MCTNGHTRTSIQRMPNLTKPSSVLWWTSTICCVKNYLPSFEKNIVLPIYHVYERTHPEQVFRECLISQSPRQYCVELRPYVASKIICLLLKKILSYQSIMCTNGHTRTSIQRMPNLTKPSSVLWWTSTICCVNNYLPSFEKNIVLPIYHVYDIPFQSFRTIEHLVLKILIYDIKDR